MRHREQTSDFPRCDRRRMRRKKKKQKRCDDEDWIPRKRTRPCSRRGKSDSRLLLRSFANNLHTLWNVVVPHLLPLHGGEQVAARLVETFHVGEKLGFAVLRSAAPVGKQDDEQTLQELALELDTPRLAQRICGELLRNYSERYVARDLFCEFDLLPEDMRVDGPGSLFFACCRAGAVLSLPWILDRLEPNPLPPLIVFRGACVAGDLALARRIRAHVPRKDTMQAVLGEYANVFVAACACGRREVAEWLCGIYPSIPACGAVAAFDAVCKGGDADMARWIVSLEGTTLHTTAYAASVVARRCCDAAERGDTALLVDFLLLHSEVAGSWCSVDAHPRLVDRCLVLFLETERKEPPSAASILALLTSLKRSSSLSVQTFDVAEKQIVLDTIRFDTSHIPRSVSLWSVLCRLSEYTVLWFIDPVNGCDERCYRSAGDGYMICELFSTFVTGTRRVPIRIEDPPVSIFGFLY